MVSDRKNTTKTVFNNVNGKVECTEPKYIHSVDDINCNLNNFKLADKVINFVSDSTDSYILIQLVVMLLLS